MNLSLIRIIEFLSLVILLGSVGYYEFTRITFEAAPASQKQMIVGEDRDIHGCIGSAGYSWCDAKQKCIHEGNESCTIGTSSPLDAPYTVGNSAVTLVQGVAVYDSVPGSASKNVYRAFGEPVYGDLNGDGVNDAVFFLTEDSGGSGTFFYIVEAVNRDGVYQGTNALFLGDRIAPQTITFEHGNVVANYAVRNDGESFFTLPSLGKSMWIHLNPLTNEIVEFLPSEGVGETIVPLQ